MVLSARDRGGAESHNGGVPRAAEEREGNLFIFYLSEGRGKCIDDPVAAGLTGLHGHGWANGYYTATCAKKKNWATSLLSCGEERWRAEVLRYASPKAS